MCEEGEAGGSTCACVIYILPGGPRPDLRSGRSGCGKYWFALDVGACGRVDPTGVYCTHGFGGPRTA